MPEAGQLGDGGLQGVVTQVGVVPAGDAGIGVAQQFGDGEQVHTQLGQGAGVGVAQFVEADLRFVLAWAQAALSRRTWWFLPQGAPSPRRKT